MHHQRRHGHGALSKLDLERVDRGGDATKARAVNRLFRLQLEGAQVRRRREQRGGILLRRKVTGELELREARHGAAPRDEELSHRGTRVDMLRKVHAQILQGRQLSQEGPQVRADRFRLGLGVAIAGLADDHLTEHRQVDGLHRIEADQTACEQRKCHQAPRVVQAAPKRWRNVAVEVELDLQFSQRGQFAEQRQVGRRRSGIVGSVQDADALRVGQGPFKGAHM
mmetsp:Transcript_22711/g.70369  ORF Transcript_22711/g.70369 Transcript_22711/m.70369 type:complete len:225 (-) Transcript_22711:1297-1971(-)